MARNAAPVGGTTHSGGPGSPSGSPLWVATWLSPLPGHSRRTRTTSMRAPAAAGSDDPDCAGDAPYSRPEPLVLDLRSIARDPAPVREALARRGDGSQERLDRALELLARRTALRPELEGLQARRNEASAAIGRAKQAGEDASAAIAEMQDVARRVKELEAESSAVEVELSEGNAALPNPPDPSAADQDTVLREWGVAATPSHPPRDHLELA